MSTRRDIDRLVKSKAEEYSIEYDPSHWNAMEALLDKHSNHQRVGPLYWALLVFILISLGMFVILDHDKNPDLQQRDIAFETTVTQEIASIERALPQNVKKNPLSEENESVNQELQISNNNPKQQLSGEFRNSDGISELPSHGHNLLLDKKSKIHIQGPGKRPNSALDLYENGFTAVNSEESPDMETISYEKPWKKLWNLGIGWQVENSWGWSTGAFASLGLRLHESISIRFRPGFTLRSDNSLPSESYKQIEYDFGRTDIQGEINKLESYAVDVPLSVQLHKQRHILSLGGGIHYAFMQKVSITERQLSNFSNFTNSRAPFFEDIEQRNAYVQPNESLFPFAELYYSYLLTPSFELGGRSRFYMPDNMQLPNRLNFAAQLVWYIN